ncbi:MAG: RNA 2',3'-cyclic phosphodiesterase, partial [Nitriliruptorales bacterium]
PHLTLARSRGRRGAPIRPEHVDAVPQVHGAWTASELVLFESVQQGRGRPNRYDPRARIALGR